MLPAPARSAATRGRTLPTRRRSTERGRRLVRTSSTCPATASPSGRRRRRPRPARCLHHGTTAQRPQFRFHGRRRPRRALEPSASTPHHRRRREHHRGHDLQRLGHPHHHLQQRRPPPTRTPAKDGTVDSSTRPPTPTGRPPSTRTPDPSHTTFHEGALLALYTDGLIERRHEDIDTGLARLAGSLTRHQADDPETLADAVLTDLLPPEDATDDTALVIARL